jgi:hypothetical protein
LGDTKTNYVQQRLVLNKEVFIGIAKHKVAEVFLIVVVIVRGFIQMIHFLPTQLIRTFVYEQNNQFL